MRGGGGYGGEVWKDAKQSGLPPPPPRNIFLDYHIKDATAFHSSLLYIIYGLFMTIERHQLVQGSSEVVET